MILFSCHGLVSLYRNLDGIGRKSVLKEAYAVTFYRQVVQFMIFITYLFIATPYRPVNVWVYRNDLHFHRRWCSG